MEKAKTFAVISTVILILFGIYNPKIFEKVIVDITSINPYEDYTIGRECFEGYRGKKLLRCSEKIYDELEEELSEIYTKLLDTVQDSQKEYREQYIKDHGLHEYKTVGDEYFLMKAEVAWNIFMNKDCRFQVPYKCGPGSDSNKYPCKSHYLLCKARHTEHRIMRLTHLYGRYDPNGEVAYGR